MHGEHAVTETCIICGHAKAGHVFCSVSRYLFFQFMAPSFIAGAARADKDRRPYTRRNTSLISENLELDLHEKKILTIIIVHVVQAVPFPNLRLGSTG